MDYSVAQQSHQGGRDYNEDCTGVFHREGYVLLVVADGLGGHDGGEIASQAFVDAMEDSFVKATEEQLDQSDTFLTLSINYAHHAIHRRAINQGYPVESPKTTCVVCLIHNETAIWAHSGDSRFYLIRQRQFEFITEDHVSKRHGRSGNNPINRCVGGLEGPRPEVSDPIELLEGDVLFLATDGAWHTFQPEDLTDHVDPQHPALGLDGLLQTLEKRNKVPSDNLSVVVLFWGVTQLDDIAVNDFDEPNTLQLLDDSIKNNQNNVENDEAAQGPASKFDMNDLDSAINEIESFISEIDEQL